MSEAQCLRDALAVTRGLARGIGPLHRRAGIFLAQRDIKAWLHCGTDRARAAVFALEWHGVLSPGETRWTARTVLADNLGRAEAAIVAELAALPTPESACPASAAGTEQGRE